MSDQVNKKLRKLKYVPEKIGSSIPVHILTISFKLIYIYPTKNIMRALYLLLAFNYEIDWNFPVVPLLCRQNKQVFEISHQKTRMCV